MHKQQLKISFIKIIAVFIAISNTAFAGNYGWGDTQNNNAMDDWYRQNQINQMQMDQQRQADQQRKQMEDMQRANDKMQQDLQRERMIRSGQGRPNSLADELYR